MDLFIILVSVLNFISFKDNFNFFFISDMQKFPLRMKDNDLLVTELYKDPSNEHITSISVYLTPKTTSEFFLK